MSNWRIPDYSYGEIKDYLPTYTNSQLTFSLGIAEKNLKNSGTENERKYWEFFVNRITAEVEYRKLSI